MSRLAILVLLAGMAAAQEEGAPPNFAQPGPCTTSTSTAKFAVPSEQRRGGLPKELSALLTIPSCQGAASAFGNPAPLLVLYNGFQVRGSAIAASWSATESPLRRRCRRRRPPLLPPTGSCPRLLPWSSCAVCRLRSH